MEPAESDEGAESRAKQFKQLDPFPDIIPALLTAADIEDYVRVTGMIFPFHADQASLKPASYEVRPGRKFIRWNEDGQREELDIDEASSFELLPNTISFVQIEPKLRLPDYIAIRFNLRITHVHRGLLLGTGPLIDPGFSGVPLIPLHNLTSETYRIRGDEGLIWMEFTKTAPNIVKAAHPPYARRGTFHSFEAGKTDRPVNYYLDRANGLMPIRSSIPQAIKNSAVIAEAAASSSRQAEISAQQAARSAEVAARSAIDVTTRLYRISLAAALGGIIAAVGILCALVIGLHQYFGQIQANVEATQSLAATVATGAEQTRIDATHALTDTAALRRELESIKAEIGSLRAGLAATVRKPEHPLEQALPPAKR
jgi:deoxycytidine triphosphate deaminase